MEPLFVDKMRVERTYTGGRLLDEWQGIVPGKDALFPEEWVASLICSRFAENPNAGLSIVTNDVFKGEFLKDVIESDPAAYMGKEHYETYGVDAGFLTKIIDSDNRLNIQTHPDKAKAKEYFNSKYGKTEAWYVMGTRQIRGEDPYILIGFKPGITKGKWVDLIERQDIAGLEACLHKLPVKPGEVYFIESGMPHALGSGCMVVEIQEPTDFTFRVEKISHSGKTYGEETYHQGIGYEKMFNCFNYIGMTEADLRKRIQICHEPYVLEDGSMVQPLLNSETTSLFGMDKVTVNKSWIPKRRGSFFVILVLEGSGKIITNTGEYNLKQADEIFMPPAITDLRIENGSNLELLISYPPEVKKA